VTYVKASELEVVPGASSTGQGGYIAVDGELVARAREVWAGGGGEGGGGEGGGEGGGGASAVRMVTEVDRNWRVPYGPMSLRVVRGSARVFGSSRGGGEEV
jgi:hypothetical protein